MVYILKYEKFIKEAVYLGLTPFIDYKFTVDRKSNYGTFNIILKDNEELNMNIEVYGSGKESGDNFIIHTDHLSYREDLDNIISSILRIMNKNKLGYKFKYEKSTPSRYLSQIYYNIKVNKEISISEFEQIVKTTKIRNKKIKGGDDLDKLIYQTL
jgi:hypothetical protein